MACKAAAQKEQNPLARGLLVLDLGEPKTDADGHPTRDTVLSTVAQTLRGRLRTSAVIGRLGQDASAALFAHTTREEGEQIAQELLQAPTATDLTPDGPVTDLSATISLATIDDQVPGAQELLDRAGETTDSAGRASCPFRRPDPCRAPR